MIVISCVLVAGLGVWLAMARWDDANKVAAIASALGAVAAVGVAVWAAVRRPQSQKSLTVSDTGRAIANYGGTAITGVSGRADHSERSVQVKRTGNATASGDGSAVTGVHLD